MAVDHSAKELGAHLVDLSQAKRIFWQFPLNIGTPYLRFFLEWISTLLIQLGRQAEVHPFN